MAAFDPATLDRWRALAIVDRDGTTVGTISEFYLDRETGYPTWALVNTGLFGATQTFVPLVHATEISDGLQVPYAKSHIKDTPSVDLHDELTPDEEAALFAHYGVEYQASVEAEVVDVGKGADAGSAGTPVDAVEAEEAGASEASGPVAAEPGSMEGPDPVPGGSGSAEELGTVPPGSGPAEGPGSVLTEPGAAEGSVPPEPGAVEGPGPVPADPGAVEEPGSVPPEPGSVEGPGPVPEPPSTADPDGPRAAGPDDATLIAPGGSGGASDLRAVQADPDAARDAATDPGADPDPSRTAAVEAALPGSTAASAGPVPTTVDKRDVGDPAARPANETGWPPGFDDSAPAEQPAGASDRWREAKLAAERNRIARAAAGQHEERSPLERARRRLERLVGVGQDPPDDIPPDDREAAERARRARLGLDDDDPRRSR